MNKCHFSRDEKIYTHTVILFFKDINFNDHLKVNKILYKREWLGAEKKFLQRLFYTE